MDEASRARGFSGSALDVNSCLLREDLNSFIENLNRLFCFKSRGADRY